MMHKPRARVVNMIPKSLSGETNQDSEPQLTVNHEDVRMIIGTSFTPDPGGGPLGPVFASFDHGQTWTLDLIIPGGYPRDQSVRFGKDSSLYAGILRGNNLALDILRSAPYSPSTAMQILVQRAAIDQPYVAAQHAEGKDRVFIGNADAKSGPWLGSMEHSPDARTAPPPAGFTQNLIDPRSPIRNLPSMRPAPHRNGTVYAAYFSVNAAGPTKADVVVARDDSFATGGSPFTALTDTGDGKAGVRVVHSTTMPWTSPWTYIGNERVGSALSIAVDPSDSRVAYLAWGDGPHPGSSQTLHVRRSTDRGATWSGDLVSVPNATNPALAITTDGKVGFLYQQVVSSGGSPRWHTHVQVSRDAWAKPAEDFLLANTPVDFATYQFDPYIGDYDDLQAVGRDFYGIFSAHNLPDLSNFPHGVVYHRNANFVTKQLLNVNNVSPVANSIDPFFFHLSWHEERFEERHEHGFGRERLEIKGLRYERLEVDEIRLEADGFGPAGGGHDPHAIVRLEEAIEKLVRRLVDAVRREEHEKH